MSDGLFVECCREVAARYPELEFEEQLLDKTCLMVCLLLSFPSIAQSLAYLNTLEQTMTCLNVFWQILTCLDLFGLDYGRPYAV